ncbi:MULTISPECIES: hypothetical protein [unclassified Streptomyces]|uniref:hypothetical protein n=1 Tax=unclassified Streptomyces TaxID=2593676 RepID=UPI002DD9C1C3|nr:hypothetical protein [Streptomyces sp. NBC_00243]WRZ17327.1 hypothetical protein OHT59_01960 [Streptomyces sp. NBC_00243]
MQRRFLSAVGVAVATILATLAATMPASAHEPIELDSSDVLPWKGPLLLNGESPAMLFGTLPKSSTARSAQLHMTAGQQLIVNLAIPDQAPENQLTTAQLPTVTIVAPNLKVTQIKPTMRVPIKIFEGTLDALLLATYTGPAIDGDYSLIVTGGAPARFVVATGTEDVPFGGVKRGEVATEEAVLNWYNTPPTAAASSADQVSAQRLPAQ